MSPCVAVAVSTATGGPGALAIVFRASLWVHPRTTQNASATVAVAMTIQRARNRRAFTWSSLVGSPTWRHAGDRHDGRQPRARPASLDEPTHLHAPMRRNRRAGAEASKRPEPPAGSAGRADMSARVPNARQGLRASQLALGVAAAQLTT